MSELKTLWEDVENLRKELHRLLTEKQENLLDPEILTASQSLNTAVTKYTELIKKKNL
ncbi:MAG: aspartyl-phosphate phosphatase Spo0E family protein [Clostridia bacterium]|nr:aspartyl-phosphate phosphatase Spo0E family protein [Clostridia bacterium]